MTTEQPIMLRSFPEAIIHVDGDAFFTSVEQSVHPHLKGKPVVSGKERGIIACASYEAKALGIKRGVQLWEARKMCPELVVLPSDYELYSIYSKRMFDIMREFSPLVEEYSIDEGFADISGMRRVFHMSYEKIAAALQQAITEKLGLTVSIGLSVSKSLAKLGSDFQKPNGLTSVPGIYIHRFLKHIPVGDVWGIGPNSTRLLNKYGIRTAYDFIQRPEPWVSRMLGKPGREIWYELRGERIFDVTTEEKSTYVSISKCKTFTSPSEDRNFVYAKLVRIIESAFIKLRRYDLRTTQISIVLREKNFHPYGTGVRLSRPTSNFQEVMPAVKQMFDSIYRPGKTYRSTMTVLEKLCPDNPTQYDLFKDNIRIEKLDKLSETVDEINGLYGKHKVCSAQALYLARLKKTDRDELPWRKQNIIKGESSRQHLNIPRWDVDV